MKAMFIHNNAYDTILLNNGTCFKSVEKKDLEFLLNPNEELDNWDGDESWTDHSDTMLNAAEAYGDVVVMVDDDYKLEVCDSEVWQRRIEFYGVNIQELFDDFLESVKDWKADHAPEMDELEVDDPMFDEDGKIVCYARDGKESYVLTDDGTGNIMINYLGTR